MKIAVDVMGTDYGPKELVLGAVNAVKEYGCETVLVGDEKIIRELLVKYGADKKSEDYYSSCQRGNCDGRASCDCG